MSNNTIAKYISRQLLTGENTPCITIPNQPTITKPIMMTSVSLEMGYEVIHSGKRGISKKIPPHQVTPYYNLVIDGPDASDGRHILKRITLPLTKLNKLGELEVESYLPWLINYVSPNPTDDRNVDYGNIDSSEMCSEDLYIKQRFPNWFKFEQGKITHHINVDVGINGHDIYLIYSTVIDDKETEYVRILLSRVGNPLLKQVANLLSSVWDTLDDYKQFMKTYGEYETRSFKTDKFYTLHDPIKVMQITLEKNYDKPICVIGYDVYCQSRFISRDNLLMIGELEKEAVCITINIDNDTEDTLGKKREGLHGKYRDLIKSGELPEIQLICHLLAW